MIKHLLKGSVVYGGANLLQKMVPLLAIPVITRYYGGEALKLYDVSFVYAYLFSWLIILGQDNAGSILYFSSKDEAFRKKVLKHGLFIQLSVFVVLALLFVPVRNMLAGWLFSSDEAIATYWLKAIFIIPGHLVFNYVQNILLWQEKRKLYVLLCLLQVVFSVSGILLTVLLDIGFDGIFYSLIISTALVSLIGLWAVRNNLQAKGLDRQLIKRLVIMGVPFALTSFFQQLVPSIDRFFLLQYGFGNELPNYSLGVKIGGLLGIGVSAFVLAFTPYSMSRIYEKEGEHQISVLFRIAAPAFLLSIPVLLLFKDVLVNIFADASYGAASGLLPLFFLGWAFDLFFYFSVLGVYKAQKSYLMLLLFLAGIVLVSLLNMLLVPVYGIYGAAASFCITKIFLFFLPLITLRKHFKLSFHVVPFLLFFGASVLGSYFIFSLELYQALLFIVAAIAAALFYLNQFWQRNRELLGGLGV